MPPAWLVAAAVGLLHGTAARSRRCRGHLHRRRHHRSMTSTAGAGGPPPPPRLDKDTDDATWKQRLTAEQYRVLRHGYTEPPGSGAYYKKSEEGVYRCAGCGQELYSSNAKFDSGSGWPAFYEPVGPGAVERRDDLSAGLTRTEVTCAGCGGHLGHVFAGEGYDNPTNERHCVNSVALKFEPRHRPPL